MVKITLTNKDAAEVCAALNVTASEIEGIDLFLAARLIALSERVRLCEWTYDNPAIPGAILLESQGRG